MKNESSNPFLPACLVSLHRYCQRIKTRSLCCRSSRQELVLSLQLLGPRHSGTLGDHRQLFWVSLEIIFLGSVRILNRWTRHDCLKISIHRGSEVPSLTPVIGVADAPLSRPCCPVFFIADSWLFPDVWQLRGEFLFGTWVRLPRNSLFWQFSFRRTFAGDTYYTMPEIHHVGFAVITTVSLWMCIFITHSEKETTQVM